MIQSKKDLLFYLREDRKVNLWNPNMSWITYRAKLFYHSADAMAYDYMKKLRLCEYAKNCLYGKSIIGRLIYYYRRMMWSRAGFKYNISIGLNSVGYGFRLLHVGIGGGL